MSGTVFSFVVPDQQGSTYSLTIRARSEDEQGWMFEIDLARGPLRLVVSNYFFSRELQAFASALRNVQGRGTMEASLLSFDEELALVVVGGSRTSDVYLKLVHGERSKSLVGRLDPHQVGAADPVVDSGFARLEGAMLETMASQVEGFLRDPTLIDLVERKE